MALLDVLCILSDSVCTIVVFVLFFIGSLPYIYLPPLTSTRRNVIYALQDVIQTLVEQLVAPLCIIP